MACRTPVRKAQTEGRQSAWQGISSLPQASLVFDFFLLLNSTGNLRVLVSRPRKKPYTLGCFLVPDFMNDRTKQRFRSVASPMMKCESLVLFDVDVCCTHTQHVRLHHLEKKKPDPGQLSSQSKLNPLSSFPSLQDASVSFWSATQPVCVSSNPWTPGTVM